MMTRWAGAGVLVTVVGLSLASADVITLKKGTPFEGTVVSVTETSVVVKTDAETRTIDRSAVRRIEFGDVLLTGIVGKVYTNAAYRVRLTAPEGWPLHKQPGLDVTSQKGNAFFYIRSIPLDGIEDARELEKGALAGLAASMPDATFGAVEGVRWAGRECRRVRASGPQAVMSVLMMVLNDHVLMTGAAVPAAEAEALDRIMGEWESGFVTLDE